MGFIPFVLSTYSSQIVGDTGAPAQSIKLPKGVYADVHMRLSGTGGSGTVALDTDPTMITRFKIKKSNEIIVDTTGTKLRALARKKTGTIPMVTEGTSAYSELVVGHYFGRHPYDKAGLLIADDATFIEASFGTLVAATAFVTATVAVTIFGQMWVGPLPAEYVGTLGCVEVEDKATATGRGVFNLHKDVKISGLLIEVATITTVGEVTLQNTDGKPVLMVQQWRDILNADNEKSDKDTAETTLAVWDFAGSSDKMPALPDLSRLTDPVLVVERGATTTVVSVDQLTLFPGSL